MDTEAEARDWATFRLASLDADSTGIRSALAARLDGERRDRDHGEHR